KSPVSPKYFVWNSGFLAQLFILPTKVIKIVEGLCGSYIWSGTNEITRKALLAWDRVCLPKAGGGLNIVNLKLWNKAAIAKHCWDLAHKKDKLWIRWIHTYYIKIQQMSTMPTPQQACWMVRKVIEAHGILEARQFMQTHNRSLIRQIYLHLLGDYSRVEWKTLMFNNAAKPKAKFIMWLMMHGKLMTSDRIANWKINVDTQCVMCRKAAETRDHLFGQCEFTQQVWTKMCNWMEKQFQGFTNWQQFSQWSVICAKGKTQHAQVFRMVYAEVAYHIWMERNRRIFEQKSRVWEQITKEIAYVVSVRVTPRNKLFVYSLYF
uniref:Reverse transcriptase zinc-binding domain-containing protein n=1 Tax=Nicotiana tabacum TaxID=4097 RepID=A0A1S4C8E5_TOBAC